jgi:hypothetical protein
VHGVVVSPLLATLNARVNVTPAALDVKFVAVDENKNVPPPETTPGFAAIVSVVVGVLLPPLPQLAVKTNAASTNAAAAPLTPEPIIDHTSKTAARLTKFIRTVTC